MMKPKADVVKVIEGALDGGADSVYDALVAEGCIEGAAEDEGGGEEKPADEGEDKPDPFAIGEKDDIGASRGKAAGFAFEKMGKKPNPFAK